MATNKKSVQRRADTKRAGRRARAWTAIVYEDSAEHDWQQKLEKMIIECLVSPYHNKDVNPTGEPKKPHWHVVISFKSPTSYAKAKEVFDSIGAVVPPEQQCRVKDFRQMARYLCHMDQPDKYQYNPADVRSIGAIDYQTLVMSASDEDAMLDEIFQAMDTYMLDSYPQVVRFTRKHHPEWKILVFRKYTRQISEYAKGLHYEEKEGCGSEYCRMNGTPYEVVEDHALRHTYGVPSSKNDNPPVSAGQNANSAWNFGGEKTTENNAIATAIATQDLENATTQNEQNFERFFCSECGSVAVVKSGKTPAGTQRWQCKDCGNRFVAGEKPPTGRATKQAIEQAQAEMRDKKEQQTKNLECAENELNKENQPACGLPVEPVGSFECRRE